MLALHRQPILTPDTASKVKDTTAPATAADSLKYPIQDRRGTALTDPQRNAVDLSDPNAVKKSVIYDPVTKQYTVYEKVGDQYYRYPTILSFDDYYKLQSESDMDDYWQTRSGSLSNLNQRGSGPTLYKSNSLFDRVFGGNKVDIRPQGNVDLTFGYQGQNIKNPVLVEQARKNGTFNFDMNINMNVTGRIGDKLKIITNYNTQANFDFQNQIKLEYTGYDDEIIKKIEAGNVSFPLRSSLIAGVQSLFGVKTQLQFGRLTVTSVLSNQKSQKQNLLVNGGAQQQDFTITADQYEDNRHFLMAQFFRDTFNYAMSNLPLIRSQANITRLEVWVTNKTGATTNARDIVALADLAEYKPYNNNVHALTASKVPNNGTNDLYSNLYNDPATRNTGTVVSRLLAMGLVPTQDFEKTYAHKLDSTQYTFNKQLGFISLAQQLQPDEVLGVAYQYTYNGRVYQVGEFSQDVPPDQNDAANSRILFLKMLKATSARPQLPIWDLMMKNIYSTGAYGLTQADFKLDVYYNDPGGEGRVPSYKRYFPDAVGQYSGAPLITVLNLDRLNSQNDPQPDGVFDYVEGYTVNSQTGKIMFPQLEPFAQGVRPAFGGNATLEKQYMYSQLYDSIKVIAQQFPQLNRYVLKGSFKSTVSNKISLNALNVPQGSVTITAGGQVLRENVDYIIDYNLGQVTILNQGILSSGMPVNVQFENNALFGQQVRNYFGTRFDYLVNDKLSLGGTIVRMSERPYYQKVNYGDDPIKNTVVGLDGNYSSDWKGLTRWLDKLPNYSTTTMSHINMTGEVARLFPGHNKLVNASGSKQGQVYIDDFEGAQSNYDLKFPATAWSLASTPAGAQDANGAIMFPEAAMDNSLDYGKNRALLAWYTIEPTLQIPNSPGLPSNITKDDQSDPRTRLVYQQEVFPNRSTDFGQAQLSTLDLAYYPKERGPYNYEYNQAQINANGTLTHPEKRWAGIMRAVDNSDFETANIEYIEFWMQDPFNSKTNQAGGQLYFNLGNVSEDVLKDSHKFFENGMPIPSQNPTQLDSTVWGRIPRYQQQITQAFDNDPAIRAWQDIGYDGLRSDYEGTYRKGYLDTLRINFGANSLIYQEAVADASNDDYHNYRGDDYDREKLNILQRYKRYSMPEGNSPVSTSGSQYSSAATNIPESEDLNHDNTMNETEEYFSYRVNLHPKMRVGYDYVVDSILVNPQLANGTTAPEVWYQFKIPIAQYDQRVGEIPDFKSIRFMRMFMTGFQDSTVLRFAKLDLVRNQWRQYEYQLKPGDPVPVQPGTNFNLTAVNIEENSSRSPIRYVLPPGIQRQNTISTNNTTLLLNEQSLSVQVCNLKDGDSRAIYKNLSMDLRQYKNLQMFIHAEAVNDPNSLQSKQLNAVIRLGSDFVGNYYEYKIPLTVTPFGAVLDKDIWPEANNLDVVLTKFSDLKLKRNMAGVSPLTPYTMVDSTTGNAISVVGNPSLGDVKSIMISIENPADDGVAKCAEVWFDELRLTGLDEKGGYGAVARMDVQLADLGTLSVSGNMHTAGFGAVDQKVNERFRDNYTQYDAATNLDLGKLLPKKAGLVIPVYAGYSQAISRPEYDPYDLDIKLKTKLKMATTKQMRDSIKAQAEDFTSITSLNFTNVRKLNKSGKKLKLWSLENFDFNYSFSQTNRHNPLVQSDVLTRNRGGFGYNYATSPKFITPFRKLIKSKSHWLALLKDFNVNYKPSLISFRIDLTRQFGATRIRNVGSNFLLQETYNKFFTFDRYYSLKWDITHSINIDFMAVNNARVDEPDGRLNTAAKKDSLWKNLLHFGRTTNYYQTITATYTLPTQKFPALTWTNITLNYNSQYRWNAASRLAIEQGNAIENAHTINVTGEFKLDDLYNKSKWLRKFNIRGSSSSSNNNRPMNGSQANNKKQQEAVPADDGLNKALKAAMHIVMALKRINVSYSENAATVLPGYMDSTKVLGMHWATMAPGVGFVLGAQPGDKWLHDFANRGLITHDTTFNLQFQQQFTRDLKIQATLEPARDLRIDLNLTRMFTKTHSELFKDTSGFSTYVGLNPYDAGGFDVSYIGIKTLFGSINKQNGMSRTFQNFQDYRTIISNRLYIQNPYSKYAPQPGQPNDPAYKYGYGRYAQDVLIPAFLAAYTGKDPQKVGLLNDNGVSNVKSNPFSSIKSLPNWGITYSGLARLEPFKNFMTNFTITHRYTGDLNMSSFNTALNYADPRILGYPGFIDSVSGNYIPYYLVPNLTLTEAFDPLLRLDGTFINNVGASIGFKKSRSLSLSLIDYQLTEIRSTTFELSGSYRVRGLVLPFVVGKNGSHKLQNDLNFRLDMSLRDDKTVNNRLDADLVIPTSGQKVIQVSPSIDYIVNNRLNLRFFYDRRQTIPVISTSYPITTTSGGLTLRFMLQQ
ncbi:cell surface protein SprA [Chitinophaga parva]|uniref:Cell surface protein SprA n=1 Tax=Chitinophaga parva TaxID=2169414 RepID=A0A2T7BQC1_9BACT|nr:cell surface protein SprA [Chitinophaga parva]PUZ29862.1 cell surface protein SprA [Chitinophaga parva]